MARSCRSALVVAIAVSVLYGGTVAADGAEIVLVSFDTLSGLECERNYKCVEAKAELDAKQRREGEASVKVTWRSADDNYGVVHLIATIPETDIAGKSFTLQLMPLDKNGVVWGVEFHDADGNTVEEHRVFEARAGSWNAVRFDQGQKAQYGWIRRGKGDFDIVLPVKEMLEIIPSQPSREKLDVTITKEADGRIRVKGNFSKVPFRLVHYHENAGFKWIDGSPVLMLRKAKPGLAR